MAYTTAADVKSYIGIAAGTTADDTLLTTLAARAQAMIDRYTLRTFEATADTTRKYHALNDTRCDAVEYNWHTIYDQYAWRDGVTGYRNVLELDTDCVSVTSVVNGDGTTISAAEYVLLPTNHNPKYAIKLKTSATSYWTYEDDPEEAISVTGRFAYSLTPPADIVQAAIELTAYLYQKRDNVAYVGQSMASGDGVVMRRSEMPRSVEDLLQMYVRRSVF